MSYERDPRQPLPPSPGLGTTIQRALTWTRIPQALGLQDCGGCKARQAWLDQHFPYRR